MFQNEQVYNFESNWNEVPGVYAIFNRSMQLLYIGQTDNFKRRMAEHQNNRTHDMHRYGPAFVKAEVVRDEMARLIKERALINSYNPPCNHC